MEIPARNAIVCIFKGLPGTHTQLAGIIFGQGL
jgi:hypothetical protein